MEKPYKELGALTDHSNASEGQRPLEAGSTNTPLPTGRGEGHHRKNYEAKNASSDNVQLVHSRVVIKRYKDSYEVGWTYPWPLQL